MIFIKGAEAVLSNEKIIGVDAVRKSRIPKSYRVGELDLRLRSERTRAEARLLNKAKAAGVPCPTVLSVEDFDIIMSLIEGARPEMDPGQAHEAGRILASLHEADIIHGDFTPANLIESKNNKTNKKRERSGLFVIDFGLGFISNDIEDKAVDVFTMLRALGESGAKGAKEAFMKGYGAYPKAVRVMERVKEVEKRVRYAF